MSPRRVLLTAFAPWGAWRENSSAALLEALLAAPPAGLELETRLYPVDYASVEERLPTDLGGGFDWALHLGQAAGRSRLELETRACNLRSEADGESESAGPLRAGGPDVLAATVPVDEWVRWLREGGAPAGISEDAGSFVCNAALYTSLLSCAELGLATRCGFLHVPLTPGQAAACDPPEAGLASELAAVALRRLLERGCCESGPDQAAK